MSSNVIDEYEDVTLVHLDDVQPRHKSTDETEEIETCVVDETIDCYEDCLVEDEAGIGEMVSIKSHDSSNALSDYDNDDSMELIVPEKLDVESDENSLETVEPEQEIAKNREIPDLSEPKQATPDSWPTLEILPGGVIKNVDKVTQNEMGYSHIYPPESNDNNTMMYACAKCPETFPELMMLVKHVKVHEVPKDKKKLQPIPRSYAEKITHIRNANKELANSNKKIVITQKGNLKRVKVFLNEKKRRGRPPVQKDKEPVPKKVTYVLIPSK